ncbi:hypothetical protein [Planctomyces sp. SH-PL62]|uniref:hypothetical protein n=1 Tax=Planctomyces sp. SH-PL62 TaxID=1636152 RepID=UPI00078C3C68|nr:hypothetical protein [Planctomyces sp. SH-PL62]AMV38125.1 hypothetical protein VT85_11855 [Planctomyces sp. SH-PL62]
MNRGFRFAPVPFILAAAVLAGCGESAETGGVDRTAEFVKADNRGQDAMREYMQSKKGGSKAKAPKAAPAKEAKPEDGGGDADAPKAE